jgi:hypothetical protein
VPSLSRCPNAEPLSYPVPTLEVLSEYGFQLKHEIEPHEWEKGKILRVAFGDKSRKRINPQIHMATIMDHIQREAAARTSPLHPTTIRKNPTTSLQNANRNTNPCETLT